MPLGLIAFAAACAFVGIGLYINITEQPARLGLAPSAMMREWTPSNRRGFILLTALALLAAILAFADYARTGDIRWTIGGVVILASGLYAYYVIEPVNLWLYTLEADAPDSGGARTHARLGPGRMGAVRHRPVRLRHLRLGHRGAGIIRFRSAGCASIARGPAPWSARASSRAG